MLAPSDVKQQNKIFLLQLLYRIIYTSIFLGTKSIEINSKFFPFNL